MTAEVRRLDGQSAEDSRDINAAVTDVDSMTQQNATMVEQAAAAACPSPPC